MVPQSLRALYSKPFGPWRCRRKVNVSV